MEILIENFQSHKNSHIKLPDERCVVGIIGLNNHGKSALIRAIRKLCRNRPLGTSIIREGSQFCKITLISENNEVTMHIKKGSVSYELKTGENEKIKFTKFGRDVPSEILSAVGISLPITISTSDTDQTYDLNFRTQFDPPFFIGETPYTRMKLLSRIINIDIFHSALFEINRSISDLSSEKDSKKLELEKCKRKLTVFKLLPREPFDRLKLVNAQLIDLRSSFNSYLEYEKNLAFLRSRLSIFQKVGPLKTSVQELVFLSKTKHILVLLLKKSILKDIPDYTNLVLLNQEIGILKYLNGLLQKASVLQRKVALLRNLKGLPIDRLIRVREEFYSLKTDYLKLKDARQNAKESYERLTAVRTEIETIFNSIEICPLCKRPMKKDKEI